MVGSQNFTNIVKNSLGVWQSTNLSSKVTFSEGQAIATAKATRDGQNIMTWGRISSANAIAITYTWYNTVNSEVIESDIIFNNKFP